MARPPRRLGTIRISPKALAAVGDQLGAAYARTEAEIIAILAQDGGKLTSWRKAFLRQQWLQIRQAIRRLEDVHARFAEFYIPEMYAQGLAVVDGYLMTPEHARIYADFRKEGLDHFTAVRRSNEVIGAPPPEEYHDLLRAGKTPHEAEALLRQRYPGTWGPGGLSLSAHPGYVTPMDMRLTRLHEDALREIVRAKVKPLSTNLYRMDEHWSWKRFYRRDNLEAIEEAFLKGQTQEEFEKRLLARYAQKQLSPSDAKAFYEAITRRAAGANWQVLEALKDRRLWVYQDAAGRDWDPKRYANMIGRTTAREASNEALYNRMRDAESDLVIIPSHADPCPYCIPWEGQVLSVDGKTKGWPSIRDAERAGLFHPNCLHVPAPYFEDVDGRLPKRTPDDRLRVLKEKRAELKTAKKTWYAGHKDAINAQRRKDRKARKAA